MDKQGGSQTIDCTTPNVVFTKERADKARETLREKLEKLSLTEIEDLGQIVLNEISKGEQQGLFPGDEPEERIYNRIQPVLAEIVRRAKERHKFSGVGEIGPYLCGVFDSKGDGIFKDTLFKLLDRFLSSLLEPQTTKELSWEELEEEMRREILSITGRRQPSARELLQMLEKKFGWRIRHIFASIIQKMRSDDSIQAYLRDYLKTVLSDEEIKTSVMGDAKPDRVFKSTLDDLVGQCLRYRNSGAFKEMIEFTAKFRDYAPYNNLLVSIQRPGCSFYATEKDWQTRFGRKIKEDATPMLILAPMHPVMLVYDLDSTEGEKPLPKNLTDFCKTEGEWDPDRLDLTLENAKRDGILVQFKELSSTMGGFATSEVHNPGYKMRIVIRKELDTKSCYNVMCHELAHIYLGHLGTDKDNWWPCRINLTHRAVEIEAEAVSYIVGIRLGLLPPSAAYLSSLY